MPSFLKDLASALEGAGFQGRAQAADLGGYGVGRRFGFLAAIHLLVQPLHTLLEAFRAAHQPAQIAGQIVARGELPRLALIAPGEAVFRM